MARDFRPKDKKASKSKPAAAPAPSAATARPAVVKPAKVGAAPAAPAKAPAPSNGGESGNDSDVDDDALMREIEAMGGNKEDLKLVKGAGKGKAKEAEIDDPTLDADVRSFMKALKFDTAIPAPITASPVAAKAKEGKKTEETPKTKDPVAEAAPKAKKANKAAAAEEQPKKDKKEEAAKKQDKEKKQKDSAAAAQKATEEADWKAQREAKAAAAREAKSSVIATSLAAAAASSKQAKPTAGGSKADRELVIQPAPHWSTSSVPPLPATQTASSSASDKKSKKHKHKESVAPEMPSDDRIAKLHERGKALLEADNKKYSALASSGGSGGSLGTLSASDAKFIASLLGGGGAGTGAGGGTLSDRIAALTLLVQSSPVHNMHAMETLLNMAGKKNREESGKATRALGDWLASGGGLGERKLRYFRDQPALPQVAALVAEGADEAAKPAINAHLLLFAFEDALKKYYFSFLQLLETQTHDTLPFVRKQATSQVYFLLRDKSEQEQNLLRLLVNKLGDGERAVASKASSHLLELVAIHPAMKAVIVREVAQLVLKPASASSAPNGADGESLIAKHNSHARYYGVLTLNQTLLTSRDDEVAARLVNLYFELFESVLRDSHALNGGKEETIEDAERAAAEAKENGEKPAAGKKDKNRWRDSKKSGKKGGKGGKKANSAPEDNKAVVDADAKMTAAILTGMRRAFPFAKLDADVLAKHMDTLFRITHTGTFNTSVQALQLIFQVAVSASGSSEVDVTATASGSSSSNVADRFYTTLYSSMLDSRLATTSKQAMYLNLLFKALKADDDEKRCMACVKRLCQTTLGGEPPWICGTLFLLGELFKARPILRTMLSEPEEDGDEHFVDAPDDDSDEEMAEANAAKASAAAAAAKATPAAATKYDPRKRDPRWAGAEMTCLWEVVPLLEHFHPSVALHATQLIESKPVTTTADLSLNTLSHFLDRFVYRNPKKTQKAKGASIMQPAAAAAGSGGTGLEASVVKTHGAGIADSEVVNSEKFWRKKAGDVPVDQLFFHQFFNQRLEREAATKSGKRRSGDDDVDEIASDDDEEPNPDDDLEGEDIDDSISVEGENDMDSGDDAAAPGGDDDSDNSDSEGEKEIWEAMKRTMPRAEGDEEILDDSDDDDEDLDQYDYVDSEEEQEGEPFDDGEEGSEDDEDDEADGLIRLDDDEDAEPDVFDEDEDDLLPFHGFEGAASDEEAAPARGKKRSAGETEADEEEDEDKPKSKSQVRRAERKKRKALPEFASVEDYAHLLDGDADEDMGV